jgi:hypothetical protein
MRAPTLTTAAVDHLDGRPLVLRASPRHGCCGGRASVPVAEVGPPDDPARYHRIETGDAVCYLDPELGSQVGSWRVDAVGVGRWRRLHLDGSQGIAPPG